MIAIAQAGFYILLNELPTSLKIFAFEPLHIKAAFKRNSSSLLEKSTFRKSAVAQL
jgi:hypothetical protein